MIPGLLLLGSFIATGAVLVLALCGAAAAGDRAIDDFFKREHKPSETEL